jgi:hypothetical protein
MSLFIATTQGRVTGAKPLDTLYGTALTQPGFERRSVTLDATGSAAPRDRQGWRVDEPLHLGADR